MNMMLFRSGLFLVVAAYFIWGVLPVYWIQLSDVPAEVTLVHRVFWSSVFLTLILLLQGRFKGSFTELRYRKNLSARFIAALLVVINWLTYVWAMGNGYVEESGLGYFLCPLLSVAFAAVVFKENLTMGQRVGLALVSVGVAIKIFNSAGLPWVALSLAISWAMYCTLRKAQGTEPVKSLFQEVIIILPLLLLAMLFLRPDGLFQWYGAKNLILLVLSGPITAIPILMLVKGFKTVRLSSVAVIQFLTPTLNLVVAICLGENFGLREVYVYIPIWLGVLVFAGVFNLNSKRLQLEGQTS